MPELSIAREIASLPATADKRYDTAYRDAGFEFGFGRAGAYRGHSHLRFIDLIFAPDGVRGLRGAAASGASTLVIAPARSYLPDVELGDFAFLKFCPDDGEVRLPDKVDDELHEQPILAYAGTARLTFPWYAHPRAERQQVEVTLAGTRLTLTIGPGRTLVIDR